MTRVYWAEVIEKKNDVPQVDEAIASCVHKFTIKHGYPPDTVQIRRDQNNAPKDAVMVGSVVLEVEWVDPFNGLPKGQIRVYRKQGSKHEEKNVE